MFELMLIACVGAQICEYVASPITYPTESRCAYAAALIAGTLRGQLDRSWDLRYQYRCAPRGADEADWVEVERPPAQPGAPRLESRLLISAPGSPRVDGYPA